MELQNPTDAGQQRAFAVFRRIVAERTGLEVLQTNQSRIVFGFRQGIGADGFSIEDGEHGAIQVRGDGMSGLMAGIGKLLRTARMEQGLFQPGTWRGVAVPQRPVRGMYFATHFFNWYHEAPMEDVRRYIEDFSLWGCNTLCVWFDMHHYQGLDEPDAQAMIRRLRDILQVAQEVGLKPALACLANEGYASSPAELRAEWALQNGYVEHLSHYHVEVCPNKPGGMEYILQSRRKVLEAFHGVDFKYIWLWPYDQGGCTCAKCAPWGANGFITVSTELSALCRTMFPKAQIVLSTWLFDNYRGKGDAEWRAFDKALGKPAPKWVDYIMSDVFGAKFPAYPLTHGVPGNLPLLNFPEISMADSHPWGGYGANPSPARLSNLWAQTQGKLSGGYPYSEGIFEDINKCIALQLYWSGQNPMETVREYMAYEFSPKSAADLAAVAAEMERSLAHSCVVPGQKEKLKALLYPPQGESTVVLYQAKRLGDAEGRFRRVQQAEKQLAPQTAHSWRWRIFYLRAALDAELKLTGGKPSLTLDAYFKELGKIYCADHAIEALRPPSRPATLDLRGIR